MRALNVSVVVVFLLIGWLSAAVASDTLQEAERLLDSGDYGRSEAMLKRIISSEPGNARGHQLLGDVYKRTRKLDAALAEYGKAISLGGENADVWKSIGTVHKWKGDYGKAAEAYNRAVRLSPTDREAREDLKSLRERRGLGVTFLLGGWEPDYTTDAYEVMLYYGGIEKLDLYAGYGYADQPYYNRTKVYAKGYYFYKPGSYFKVNPQYKDYDYPVAKVATPDANSYDKVPSLELEVQHWLREDLRGNLIYEYFRPSFFHDKDSSADNHKVTGELYYMTPIKHLRAKLVYAILRDPDPDTTTIKGRTCLSFDALGNCTSTAAATNVEYQTQQLLGGGVEYSRDRWNAEVKYMPNRDLDSSYEYSFLTYVSYDINERLTGRLDYVYDKYSTDSNFAGETANVYMVSASYELSPRTDLGAGYKHLDLPTGSENTGFLSLSYKTGLGF